MDAIARQYHDYATRKVGGEGGDHQVAAFTSGLKQIEEIMPSLLNDFLPDASNDYKDKIKKLIDIWERSETFPLQLLNFMRDNVDKSIAKAKEMSAEAAAMSNSGRPLAPSPPPPPGGAKPAANTASILQALAQMAKQAQTKPQSPSLAQQQSKPLSTNNNPLASSLLAAAAASQDPSNLPPPPPSLSAATAAINKLSKQPDNNTLSTQQIAVIQLLLQQGVPLTQIQQVLQSSSGGGGGSTAAAAAAALQMPVPPVSQVGGGNPSVSNYPSQMANSYNGGVGDRYSGGGRRRSPSPRPFRRGNSPHLPYDNSNNSSSSLGRRRNRSRSRSPPPRPGLSPPAGIPRIAQPVAQTEVQHRNLERDEKIGADNIRGLVFLRK